MSFDQASALESQPVPLHGGETYTDHPEFNNFTADLSDKLLTLTSTVSRLSNQVGLLGTRRETERVRERVKDLIDEGGRGFKEVGESLKKVISWPDVGVRVERLRAAHAAHPC
jgi:Syntaxin-like protein